MNKKYEKLAEQFTGTTIKDSICGSMVTLEEISKAFKQEITLNNKWYKLDDDTYLQIIIEEKQATWIYLEIFDKADYITLTTEYIEEMKQDYKNYIEEMQELEIDNIISFEEYAGI